MIERRPPSTLAAVLAAMASPLVGAAGGSPVSLIDTGHPQPWVIGLGALCGVLAAPACAAAARFAGFWRWLAWSALPALGLATLAAFARLGLIAPCGLVLAWLFVAAGVLERRFGLADAPGNLCPQCGYALEGLARPVCPECGTPVAPQE